MSDVDPRRIVHVEAERVSHVSSTDYPGHYPDEDHSWDLEKFRQSLKVEVTRLSNRSIEFDLVGVDASVANAFRRIMIAEVPTVAIEHVYVWNNTTVVQDEVLAHRIGLVPLNVDPALIEMKADPTDTATDRNTLVFHLKLSCTHNPSYKPPKSSKLSALPAKSAPSSSVPISSVVPSDIPVPSPDELYVNHELKSGHLQWQPAGEQEDVFGNTPPAPANKDIVLAKMRPGQEVEIEMHAVKGVGKDHAKFSPVATASYRLLPLIKILQPIPPNQANKFASCFAPSVIRIDPKTGEVSVDERNVRRDTVSREVLRHSEFVDKVQLGRIRDYFLFSVESEGPYAPERLLPEAVKVMRGKLAMIKKAVVSLTQGEGEEDAEMAEG
ncbi:DNA-directed RNA polymerase [Cyathus striatus]|nr:DNA-directed RNA polymerase [Cyathus striatus]